MVRFDASKNGRTLSTSSPRLLLPNHHHRCLSTMTQRNDNVHQCSICFNTFKRQGDLLSHQRQRVYCRDRLLEVAEKLGEMTLALNDFADFETLEDDPPGLDGEDDPNFDFALLDDFAAAMPAAPAPTQTPTDPQRDPPPAPNQTKAPPHKADIDVFPDAGNVIREEQGVFEQWNQKYGHNDNPYFPFSSKLEWDIARWAKQEGPGANSLDHLLRFDSVSNGSLPNKS